MASPFIWKRPNPEARDQWNGCGSDSSPTPNGQRTTRTLSFGPQSNPGQHLDLEYDYDEGVANTGQIMSIVDRNDSTKTVNYAYDDFNRLQTAATVGAHWGLSWSYDRYGNRLSQTKTKGTAPTVSLSVDADTNRVNGWSYDAAGNTLDDGNHAYAYDANNMITSVDGGAVQYKYDASGQRVSKTTAGETVYYAFGAEYSSAAGWRRVFVDLGAFKVEYRDGQTYFHQNDHLGTPRVQTYSAGNLVETWSYYPFGEQWEQIGSGGNEHRFTGHRRDPETGNEYAGARYLSSEFGRWLSADPVLGDLSQPQRLNRYRYAGNDPVNFRDPDGREEGPWSITVVGEYPRVPRTSAPITVSTVSPGTAGVGGGAGFHPPAENEWPGPPGTGQVRPFTLTEDCQQQFSDFLSHLDNMETSKSMASVASAIRAALGSLSSVGIVAATDIDMLGETVEMNLLRAPGWFVPYALIRINFNVIMEVAQNRNPNDPNEAAETYATLLSSTILHELAHSGFFFQQSSLSEDEQHELLVGFETAYQNWLENNGIEPCVPFKD